VVSAGRNLGRELEAKDANAMGLRSTTVVLAENRSSRVQARPWRAARKERNLAKVEVAGSKPVSRSNPLSRAEKVRRQADLTSVGTLDTSIPARLAQIWT
jgi:hypothetical protein